MTAVDEQQAADRARQGDRDAFERLYEAHAGAAWRLALAIRRHPAEAADAVAEAFGKVLSPGGQTPGRLPPALLRATREAAVGGPAHLAGSRAGTKLDLGASRAPEGDGDAAQAFDRLPERWRSALWLMEVERLSAADAAVVLGLTPEDAQQLHTRARAGLHEQLIQSQLRSAVRPDCQRTAVRLGAYAASTLSQRDSVRVRRHLDRCPTCRGRLEAIDDLAPRLRRGVPALVPSAFTLALLIWTDRTAAGHGPLGLTLPGGRPLPAWSERALAGVTAGVMAFGITAAILAGGRPPKEPTERLAATDEPFGAPDGESALSDEYPPFDGPFDGGTGSGPTASSSGGTTGAGTGTGSGSDPSAGGGRGPSTSSGGGTPTTAPPSPGPGAPSTPPPSGPSTPPASPPTTSAPPAIGVTVDGVAGITVGGECTDIVLGTTSLLGCGTSSTESGIEVGGSLLPPLKLGL